MEESELTKKAIEELMREMDEFKEKESLPAERKKNPLGRPNKRFLGRTINSIMTHNKRQSDRNQQRCERKLRELDAKQRKREFRNHRRELRRHSKSESSHEIFSSDSADGEKTYKRSKKVKKKKRRNKKQRWSSTSSSSSSSSSETDTSSSSSSSVQSKHKIRKKKKHKKPAQEEFEQNFYNDYCGEVGMGYYVDPNVAYAAMAYSQMNHMLQQQRIVQHQMVKEELEETIDIPSDLSLTYHSESSLNISLNSSSAEEDENGILTFKLSSEDEIKVGNNSKMENKHVTNINKNTLNMSIESEDSDKDSLHSHISLESEASHRGQIHKNNEIYLLDSSSSDSEDLKIVEIIDENKNNALDNEINTNGKLDDKFQVLDKENKQNTTTIASERKERVKTKGVLNDVIEKHSENLKSIEKTTSNISMVDLTEE